MTADLSWYLNHPLRKADRMPEDPMVVLLKAARNAATEPKHLRPLNGSVLRGAPSHTGAELLSALRDLGWELVAPEVGDAVRQLHRAARVSVVDDGARVEFERVAPEAWRDTTEVPPDLQA